MVEPPPSRPPSSSQIPPTPRPPDPPTVARDTVPDDISVTEDGPVSTEFHPETKAQVTRAARWLVLVLVVGFLVVWGFRLRDAHGLSSEARANAAAAPPVDVVIARQVSAGQPLVLPGQTAAWYESTIYARVSGYVRHWSADIGDHVKKGQVLADIETPELDAQLAAARAQLTASQSLLTARRAEREFARTTNDRWSGSPKGVVSDQERESKRADFDAASARLYAAEAQVTQDRSRVAQYAALAEFKKVRAPFDGTITQRRIDIGNLVTAGSTSSTTPLYQLTQGDPLRVFVDVPQSAAPELMRPGIPAQIRANGGVSTSTRTGKTARSAEAINPQARTMRVEVDLPNPNGDLLPGMYVTARFDLPARGSVVIPAAALIFRPQGPQVARVDARERVEFADVTIARDDGNVVELGSGVSPGDRLILNPSSQLALGQAVAARLDSDGGRGLSPAAAQRPTTR